MGFEDNAVSVPDALPRYVDEFADRFETDYDGPSDRYRVTARLALGYGLSIFYAHVEERDDHLLLPLGDEASDRDEIDRLEHVVRGLTGPNATDVAEAFRAHVQANYDQVHAVDGCVFYLPCQYAPAVGGRPTMVLQTYANPASESLSVGYTPQNTDSTQEVEDYIGKNVSPSTVEEYVDRLVYRIDTAIHEEWIDRNVVQGADRATLEALGFRRQTTKPVPDHLHPEHGAADAELWQVPASNAVWADGATGFIRIWRLPDDTGIIDPVNLDGPHDEEVAETKHRLAAV